MVGSTVAHYRITAKLGEGGMGEVYRATDTKLGREVALKVLPAEMAAEPQRIDRFRREAKALAALDHPGVVTVYSVEEAVTSTGSVHFLTMQLVEGQPLDQRIPEGGLPVEQILKIATGLADALAAAHERGIIHRDLKPANVILTSGGRVKVLDFGLARMSEAPAVGPEDAERSTELITREGVVMGTVPYMSPEQISGRGVDHRSDLFSLGVILYEVATGRRPFKGLSSAELASAILRDTPPQLGELRRDLPAGLARMIEGCLEKNADDRPGSARELCDGLRDDRSDAPPTEATVVLPSRPATPAVSGSARADDGFWVAVLPFKRKGADSDLESLSEGLSEEIVTGLSRFSHLRVLSRSATSRYDETSGDARAVGGKIGARYVMEGSLRRAGSQLRVTVQLVDSDTGAHLWAESYDRSFQPEQIFAIQDDLVPRIVSTCADHFGVLARAISEAVRGKPLVELTPYEALMRGFGYHFRLSAEEHAEARDALEHAVEQAPNNADCWAMLSWVYSHEYAHEFNSRPGSLDRALDAARRAVDLAPSNHLAQQVLAVARFFRKETAACRSAAERALELNPLDGSNEAIFLLAFLGDWARSCDLIRRSMELNPHHPGWYRVVLGLGEYRKKNYRAAVDEALKTNLPDLHWTCFLLAAAYGQLGETVAARKVLGDLLAVREDFAESGEALLAKWFQPEMKEHLMVGLRKAGLASAPGAGKPSDAAVAIAVLPFSDMSPAKDMDYLCEGMAEEIMNSLVRVPGFRVASRTSTFRAALEGGDLTTIATALSVGHILEGSVRAAGERLRVTAQLTDVGSGYQLWSERFDRGGGDIFAIQDEIAGGVVDAVRSRLAPETGSVPARPRARNLDAYRRYLKGRHLRANEDHEAAHQAFEEAIRLDPSHAPSYTALAEVTMLAAHFGLIPPREGCATAHEALETARELQGENAEGLHAAALAAFIERRWEAMEATWLRALELEPNHVLSLGALGLTLCTRRRLDDAIPFFERAIEADPLASFPYVRAAVGYVTSGRPEDALRYAEDGLTFGKEDFTALFVSSMAKVALGRHDEGIAEAERAVELSRRGPMFVGTLGWALATAGRGDEARAVLDELKSRDPDSPAVVSESWLLGALGEHDAAFEVIEKSFEEYQAMLYYTGFPTFDPLRDDPRFAALLERLELPSA